MRYERAPQPIRRPGDTASRQPGAWGQVGPPFEIVRRLAILTRWRPHAVLPDPSRRRGEAIVQTGLRRRASPAFACRTPPRSRPAPQFLLQAGRQAMVARRVVLADDPNVVRPDVAAVAMMIDEAVVVIVVLLVFLPMTAVVVPRFAAAGAEDGEQSEGGSFHDRASSRPATAKLNMPIARVVRCKSVRVSYNRGSPWHGFS